MSNFNNEVRTRRKSYLSMQPRGTAPYSVQQSDTLASIAAQFNSTISVLKKLNRLMSDLVFPGQVLLVPDEDYIPDIPSPTSPSSTKASTLQSVNTASGVKRGSGDPKLNKMAGHVERLHCSETEDKVSLPRPLSTEEVKKLLEECDERFIKLNVQRFIPTQPNTVPGVMLVTPDCVMFDPGLSDGLGIESGSERYAMMLPMNCVMNVSVYHDLTKSPGRQAARSLSESAAGAQPCPGESLVDDRLSVVECDTEQKITTTELTKLEGDTAADCDKNVIADHVEIASSSVVLSDVDKTDTTDHLRIYLCINGLTSGAPLLKEKLTKSDKYWFTVPHEKVDQLYAFFVQWSLNACDDKSFADEHGFIVVSNLDEKVVNIDELPSQSSQLCRSTSFSKDWEAEVVNEDVMPSSSSYGLGSATIFVTLSTAASNNLLVNIVQFQQKIAEAEIENLPLPALSDSSDILDEAHIRMFMEHLPARAEGGSWQLIYSTNKHGFSLRTLYRHMANVDSPVLVIIKDHNDQVFGTMQSCPIKRSDLFCGTGESYLFSFSPEFKKYRWTGANNFFVKGSSESLCFGASKGNNGLWLDGDLYHGRTQNCQTYNNDVLSAAEDFTIKYLEAWGFA